MRDCTKRVRPVLQAYDDVRNCLYLYQPRCKQWDCPNCGGLNKSFWQAKIGNGWKVYQGRGIVGWHFVTITSHEKLENENQCLHVWDSAWPKLSARMRRKFKGIRYVILPEHHEDTRVHWHMIASHWIGERWVKDNCRACGLGYMGESDYINDEWKAIMYVSKYLGKGLIDTKWPEGLRRINTSQLWPQLPVNEDFIEQPFKWAYLCQWNDNDLEQLIQSRQEESGLPVKIIGAKAKSG